MIDNLREINVRGGGLPSSKFASPFLVESTCDFGELQCLGAYKMEAGDNISGEVNQWSYFAALPAPVFGRFTNITRAFFVPYTQIYKTYNDLLAGNRVTHAADTTPREVKNVPLISNQDFAAFFFAHCVFPTAVISPGSTAAFVNDTLSMIADEDKLRSSLTQTCYLAKIEPDNYQTDDAEWEHYDIVTTLASFKALCNWYDEYINPGDTSLQDKVEEIVNAVYDGEEPGNRLIAFNLTKYGKLCRNRLISLGYGFDLGYTWLDKQMFPAGMLLAMTKAAMDWLIPTRYYNDEVFVRLRKIIEECSQERVFNDGSMFDRGSSETGFTLNFNIKFLDDFFILPFLSSLFFNDYFTTAYDDTVPNIVVPQPVMQEWHDIVMTNYPTSGVSGGDFDSIAVGAKNNAYGNVITSPLVVSVGKLQDMINSARVGGTAINEWLKNEFGITPSNDAMGISTYLGSSRTNVVVGEIAATSAGTSPDGTGSKTGEFAGKAFIDTQRQGGFKIKSFECREAGYLIFTHELVAEPQYFNGLHNEAMEKGRYDFYNPRLDGIDFEPVYHRELANWGVNRHMAVRPQDYERILNNSIFGLQPMYTRKKIRFDMILGDFITNSRNTGLDCWFIARNFFDGRLAEALSQLNSFDYQLALSGTVINDFNRIFYDQNSDFDHVKTYFTFDLHENRKMLPYKDSVDFTSGKDVKPSNQGSLN